MFSLKLFGGAILLGPTGPLTGRLAQRRRLALLAVLAAGGGRPVSRDRLLALFWPESDAERARHSLADSVYHIRRELGESAVVSRGEDLWLDAEVIGCDVVTFEDAVARGDLRAAIAVYGGPFLDGFHISDAPDFERWVDEQRDRLGRAYARVTEQLAEEAAARGEARESAEWWLRLSALDPLNARTALRLMAALDAAGDRAGAIQHARVHTALLEQELGAAADAEVAAFAERLRRGTSPPGIDARADHERAPAEDAAVSATEKNARADPGAAWAATLAARGRRRRLAAVSAIPAVALAAALLVMGLRGEDGSVAGSATGTTTPHTLVVLPCSNPGGDPEEVHFSDGLTEELIATLSQVHELRVVARTSAFAMKGQNRDVREIARILNVSTVVECSVRRADERFRVTAQLVNAADGLNLWADTYQREGTDVLDIQSDLALRIAQALQAELTPDERARLARRPTEDSEAHALYLKGSYFWNQRTPDAYRQAIEYFERAIAIDSSYSAAWAGLARAYSLQGLSGHVPPAEARQRMGAAVRRAVELDDASAEAHAELGAYLHLYEWDTAAAERAYRRAIALAPDYSVAHHLYGNMLGGVGRAEESLAQKRIAARLDPLSPQLSVSLGNALLLAGIETDALSAFRDAVELDSMAWTAHTGLGELYMTTGRRDAAVHAFRRAARLAPDHPEVMARLASALAWAGEADEARRIVAALRADGERRRTYVPNVAFALLALGEADAAYGWLDRSFHDRHPRLRLIGGAPEVARITDPRILDLLRRSRS